MRYIIYIDWIVNMYVFERQIWFILTADWLLFWVYYQKSQEKLAESTNDSTIIGSHQNLSEPDMFGNESIHQQDLAWNVNLKNFVELRFANLMDYCIPAFIISYLFFFGIGGYLHVRKNWIGTNKKYRFLHRTEIPLKTLRKYYWAPDFGYLDRIS